MMIMLPWKNVQRILATVSLLFLGTLAGGCLTAQHSDASTAAID
jgi:hypothetical protein